MNTGSKKVAYNVGGTVLGCYLLKLAGLSVPARVLDRPAVARVADLIPVAHFYKRHREQRIDQIVAALADMGVSPFEAKPMKVVRKVYADVDKKLWPAARSSVKAQLDYLRGENA